ncbi:MAG: hypothetical protein AAFP93_01910 [Bacteroidota bacterium]
MNAAARLPETMVMNARTSSRTMKRSAPRQIEYWDRAGKIAEDNPDLPYSFIRDILSSQEEVAAGQLAPYQFASS